MKTFLSAILILMIQSSATAQRVLMPYTDGNKMGLSDESGKIVIKPAYDNVRWVGDHFFETESKLVLNDTIETSPHHISIRKNLAATLKSIIYNGQVIIKNEPYYKATYFPDRFIIASYKMRGVNLTKEQNDRIKVKEDFYSLYNLDGKNIYPDNFHRLDLKDSLHIKQDKTVTTFALFLYQDFNGTEGMFVYDCNKRQISAWPLTAVYRIKYCKVDDRTKTIHVEYDDANSRMVARTIDYSAGKFLLADASLVDKRKNAPDRQVVEVTGRDLRDGPIAVPTEADMKTDRMPEYKLPPMYELKQDSVFYRIDKGLVVRLKTNKDMTLIMLRDIAKMQVQPVVYKQADHFGLITKDSTTSAFYDSLFYFGDGYLGYKNKKCGVVGRDGKITIPFIYDSIQVMKQFQFTDGSNSHLVLQEETDRYATGTPAIFNQYKKPADRILVFKNGKAGMITMHNESILPVIYDIIALNSYNFGSYDRNSDYIILKKNGRYGMLTSILNRSTKQYETTEKIEPVFPAFPGYYLKNYYGVKDYRLFALYDEQFNFRGYANEKGVLYFKK